MTQDEKHRADGSEGGNADFEPAETIGPGRRLDIDDPRLTPAMRAALVRTRSGKRVELSAEEQQQAWQHLRNLGPEFQVNHSGQIVSIDPATGRYALGRTAMDSEYAFEQSHGSARLMNVMLGPARNWGL